jgi:hypothetical protein
MGNYIIAQHFHIFFIVKLQVSNFVVNDNKNKVCLLRWKSLQISKVSVNYFNKLYVLCQFLFVSDCAPNARQDRFVQRARINHYRVFSWRNRLSSLGLWDHPRATSPTLPTRSSGCTTLNCKISVSRWTKKWAPSPWRRQVLDLVSLLSCRSSAIVGHGKRIRPPMQDVWCLLMLAQKSIGYTDFNKPQYRLPISRTRARRLVIARTHIISIAMHASKTARPFICFRSRTLNVIYRCHFCRRRYSAASVNRELCNGYNTFAFVGDLLHRSYFSELNPFRCS